mmetsp:Transcript_3240/g.7816  ORF Transcript_3240/g.7816 Transcript_3240/m.7816 type:complete len:259 (+) Transcript_3240:768-1544(+)
MGPRRAGEEPAGAAAQGNVDVGERSVLLHVPVARLPPLDHTPVGHAVPQQLCDWPHPLSPKGTLLRREAEMNVVDHHRDARLAVAPRILRDGVCRIDQELGRLPRCRLWPKGRCSRVQLVSDPRLELLPLEEERPPLPRVAHDHGVGSRRAVCVENDGGSPHLLRGKERARQALRHLHLDLMGKVVLAVCKEDKVHDLKRHKVVPNCPLLAAGAGFKVAQPRLFHAFLKPAVKCTPALVGQEHPPRPRDAVHKGGPSE